MKVQGQIIAVKFINSTKNYHYFSSDIVKVGDPVVVDSPYGGYTVVEVIGIVTSNPSRQDFINRKHVVSVIDDEGFKKKEEALEEVKAIKKAAKKALYQLRDRVLFSEVMNSDSEEARTVRKCLKLGFSLEEIK